MIISHQHQFIFLKTNKTAGTSIEIALSRFCGDDDVITPIAPEDELLREEWGGRKPQNYQTDEGQDLFYNYMPARKIKRCVPPEVWTSYYKFCVERNPWDRVISAYYWVHKEEPRPSLAEFLQSKKIKALKKKGYSVYTIRDRVVVDHVCLYESLDRELERVCERTGISEPLELPRAKGAYRGDRRPYQELYTPEDAHRIAELFAEEIALFGYTF